MVSPLTIDLLNGAGSLKRPSEPFHQIPDLILGDKDLRWIVIGEVVVCKVVVCEVVV
jgi:hypothetical protein